MELKFKKIKKWLEWTLFLLGSLHVFSRLINSNRLSEFAHLTMASPAPVPFSNLGLHTDKFISPHEIIISFEDGSNEKLNYHNIKRNIPGPTRYRMSFVGADHNVVNVASFKHRRNLVYGICSKRGPMYQQLKTDKHISHFTMNYDWPWREPSQFSVEVKCDI